MKEFLAWLTVTCHLSHYHYMIFAIRHSVECRHCWGYANFVIMVKL